MKPIPEVPPVIVEENLTPKQEQRYEEIGRKAVIAQHKQIASFIKSRHFPDDGLIRGLIVEFVKFSSIFDEKVSDEEL